MDEIDSKALERIEAQAAHVALGLACRVPDVTGATKELLRMMQTIWPGLTSQLIKAETTIEEQSKKLAALESEVISLRTYRTENVGKITLLEEEISNLQKNYSELLGVNEKLTFEVVDLISENKMLRGCETRWAAAFAAQSRKLHAVLHIPGVKEEIAALSKPAALPAEGKGESEDFQDGWDAHELHIAMHNEPYQIAFPTMLRKMWSGTEVQAWLDKLPPLYELPATPPAPQPVGDDEAYEIGKRDGYEEAIQDLDLATGGDGEFKGSSFVEDTVDVPVMKQRIIDRLTAPQPVGEVRKPEWPALVQLGRTLGFFASAIKSGEAWSSVCQSEYDKANAAIKNVWDQLSASPSPAAQEDGE